MNKGSAASYLRTRAKAVRLGDLAAPSLREARIAAAKARADVASGADPSESLHLYNVAVGLGEEDPEDLAWPTPKPDRSAFRRQHGPWTLGDLVEEFVAWKKLRLRAGYGE